MGKGNGMNIPDALINWIAEKITEQDERIKSLELINKELSRQSMEQYDNMNLLKEENKALVRKTALLSSELDSTKYELEQAKKALDEDFIDDTTKEPRSTPILDSFYSINGVAELLGLPKTMEQEAHEAQERILADDEFDGELK